MAKKREETGVATTPGTAVGAPIDYGTHAGKGKENVLQSDYVLPFCYLCQSGTPFIKKQNPAYVEGVSDGDFFISVVDRIFNGEDGMEIVPAYFDKLFIEQWPKPKDGEEATGPQGFVGTRPIDDPEALAWRKRENKTWGKVPTEKGTELVETFQVYCVCYTPGEKENGTMCAFSLKSTKILPFRQWLTALEGCEHIVGGVKQELPLYASAIHCKTKAVHENGFDFNRLIMKPSNGGIAESLFALDDPRFIAGARLCEMVSSGAATVDHSQNVDTKPGEGGTVEPEDDIPF